MAISTGNRLRTRLPLDGSNATQRKIARDSGMLRRNDEVKPLAAC